MAASACQHRMRIVQQNWFNSRLVLVILKCEHCPFTRHVDIAESPRP